MEKISNAIRRIASSLSNGTYWAGKIYEDFGIKSDTGADPIILRQTYQILSKMPVPLVKACGIKRIIIRDDMGPNKPYYPNHGYFMGDSVTLNSDIFYSPDVPDDFVDHRGYFLTRPEQTLIHEMAHGYDEYNDTPSLKNDWLGLSGWKEKPEPGLKRVIIRDKGAPEVVGEWFYHPESEFTRFYARRNPWDDYADSFAFYAGGLKNRVPNSKKDYFDKKLAKFY